MQPGQSEKIYRVKVETATGEMRTPAFRVLTPANAIESAAKLYPYAMSIKVVAELIQITEDWGVDYRDV
jgi:hypothetical protein